jgi:hypothetical protein
MSTQKNNTPYLLEGTAISGGETTRGKNGLKKWPTKVLKEAAGSLEGKNLVTAHQNDPHGVVGEITRSWWDNGEVKYRAELDDEELAEKVKNGRLDVSARLLHRNPESLPENSEGAVVIDKTAFDNLSLVTKPGASSSNSVGVAA